MTNDKLRALVESNTRSITANSEEIRALLAALAAANGRVEALEQAS